MRNVYGFKLLDLRVVGDIAIVNWYCFKFGSYLFSYFGISLWVNKYFECLLMLDFGDIVVKMKDD